MSKTQSAHQPWHKSYKKSLEVKPHWSQHGMPTLFDEFVQMVKKQEGFHLDIGCGNGVKTVNFALQGLDTIGVDIAKDGLKEANKLIKKLDLNSKCRVVQADCLRLPKDLPKIKSVSDFLCYTHLKEAEQSLYKANLIKLLPVGGYGLFVLFSASDKHFHGHSINKRYDFQFDPNNPLMEGYQHYQDMHNVHFNEEDILRDFAKFRVVKLIEVQHPMDNHRRLWEVIVANNKSSNE